MFYRLELPFIDIDIKKVELLRVPSVLQPYLGAIGLNIDNPVFINKFNRVAEICKVSKTVGITGAKGCGKHLHY